LTWTCLAMWQLVVCSGTNWRLQRPPLSNRQRLSRTYSLKIQTPTGKVFFRSGDTEYRTRSVDQRKLLLPRLCRSHCATRRHSSEISRHFQHQRISSQAGIFSFFYRLRGRSLPFSLVDNLPAFLATAKVGSRQGTTSFTWPCYLDVFSQDSSHLCGAVHMALDRHHDPTVCAVGRSISERREGLDCGVCRRHACGCWFEQSNTAGLAV